MKRILIAALLLTLAVTVRAQIPSASTNINFSRFLQMRKIGSIWTLFIDSVGDGHYTAIARLSQAGSGTGSGVWGSFTGNINTQADLITLTNLKVPKTTAVNGYPLSGNVNLVAGDVGLSNVPNVNATLRANHTGSQLAATISDFATALRLQLSAIAPVNYNTSTGAIGLNTGYDTTLAATPFRQDQVVIGGISYNRLILPEMNPGIGDSGYVTPQRWALKQDSWGSVSAHYFLVGPSSGGALPPTARLVVKSDMLNTTMYTDQTNDMAGNILQGNSMAVNLQSGTTYTLAASDNGKTVSFSSGTAVTLTVPAGLVVGFNCAIVQLGAGQVTFTASGTTINNRSSFTKTVGLYAMASILCISTNTFVTGGDMQ